MNVYGKGEPIRTVNKQLCRRFTVTKPTCHGIDGPQAPSTNGNLPAPTVDKRR
jgi:hypothetical protein